MPDYTAQLNQARKIRKKIRVRKKSIKPNIKIDSVEWILIFSLAIISDLAGPIGFLCGPFILLWYVLRFHNFPFKKIIGFGSAEVLSLGLLPGWIGFVLISYLKQKGYLPKWLKRK